MSVFDTSNPVDLVRDQDARTNGHSAAVTDIEGVASVTLTASVRRHDARRPKETVRLRVFVEQSADGVAWTVAHEFAFTDSGSDAAVLVTPADQLRVSWQVVGGSWDVTVTAEAAEVNVSGGGGASFPEEWTVGDAGDLTVATSDGTKVSLQVRRSAAQLAAQRQAFNVLDEDEVYGVKVFYDLSVGLTSKTAYSTLDVMAEETSENVLTAHSSEDITDDTWFNIFKLATNGRLMIRPRPANPDSGMVAATAGLLIFPHTGYLGDLANFNAKALVLNDGKLKLVADSSDYSGGLAVFDAQDDPPDQDNPGAVIEGNAAPGSDYGGTIPEGLMIGVLSVKGRTPAGLTRSGVILDGRGQISTFGNYADVAPFLLYDNDSNFNEIYRLTATGAVEFREQADPAAPAADYGRLYVRDNGSGKSQLCVRFASGAVQVVATQP